MTTAVDHVLAGAGPGRIRALLPHRHPMALVDRIVELRPGVGLRALKAVTASEPWYAALEDDRGPHPDPAYDFPEALLVESWCQAAGVLATWDAPNPDVRTGRVMLFGAISGITVEGPVRPGDVVEHDVRLDRSVGDTVIFSGRATVAGRPVLTVGRVVVAFRPAGDLRPTDQTGERTHG